MVTWLDEHGKSFHISRLILSTGIRLRSYAPSTPDDPEVLRKLGRALCTMLSASEWAELSPLFND